MLATIRILAEMREGGFSYNSNADVFCWHLKCEDFQKIMELQTWYKKHLEQGQGQRIPVKIVGGFYISEVSETFAV